MIANTMNEKLTALHRLVAIGCVFSLLAWTALAVNAPPPNNAPTTVTNYHQLWVLFHADQSEKAIALATHYLNNHPTDGDTRLLLGQFYFQTQQYAKARHEFNQVLAQTPHYIDAALGLINIELLEKNYQTALEITDQSLVINPIDPDLQKRQSDLSALLAQNEKLAASKPKITVKTNAPSLKTQTLTPEYQRLEQLYVAGAQQEAIQQAHYYLNKHPKDGDVRLKLGAFYFDRKEYANARKELLIVLQQTPTYVDARITLINIDLATHAHGNALALVNQGLIYNPSNGLLQTKKKQILAASAPRPAKIKPVVVEKKPVQNLNEIGVYQQNYYISDVRSVWDYSTLYYGRQTKLGKVYGKVNYNSRLSHDAFQAEIEAYPKINKFTYLDIDVAFANEPNLFPNQMYGLEAYITPNGLYDFSLGGKANVINSLHQYYLLTGTFSANLDHERNRVTFRPYFFIPNSGSSSTLYTLNLRHYVTAPHYYVGCIVGLGTSPDLANLETIDFIVVQNKLINPYINFPLFDNQLLVNLSALFQQQNFPNNRVRNWSGGSLGLSWFF